MLQNSKRIEKPIGESNHIQTKKVAFGENIATVSSSFKMWIFCNYRIEQS